MSFRGWDSIIPGPLNDSKYASAQLYHDLH